MKTLSQLTEDVKISKKLQNYKIQYRPNSYLELKKIINEKHKKMINGYIDCKDIDVSYIDELGSRGEKYAIYSNGSNTPEYEEFGLFRDLKGIKTIDIYGWNTSNVKYMSYMFWNCEDLQEIIGINNIDVSNVISMQGMFGKLPKLTKINLSGWNPEYVKNIRNLFAECENLRTLDLSWKTPNLDSAEYAFDGCKKLIEINGIENWNPKKSIDTDFMFDCCYELKSRPSWYMK